MTAITQRFVMHGKLAKGGYMYMYEIRDGDKLIGGKTVHAESRKGPEQVTYTLNGSEQEFHSAKELIEAYEAQKNPPG